MNTQDATVAVEAALRKIRLSYLLLKYLSSGTVAFRLPLVGIKKKMISLEKQVIISTLKYLAEIQDIKCYELHY